MIGEKKFNYQKSSSNNVSLDDYLSEEQKKKKANSSLLAAYTNPQQETASTLPYRPNTSSATAGDTSTANNNSVTLKDYYGSAQSSLEQNRQKQLEEAYVNNQLINKYFPESMAKQGLANTGIEELYKQKANNDYRNERATINSNFENNQLNLLENYYTKQKADEEAFKQEQKTEEEKKNQDILDWYSRIQSSLTDKITKNMDDDGVIDDSVYDSLYKYIDDNKSHLNDHYSDLLKNYLSDYKMSDEQRKKKKDEEEKLAQIEATKNNANSQKEIDEREIYKSLHGYYPDASLWEKIKNYIKSSKLMPWNYGKKDDLEKYYDQFK